MAKLSDNVAPQYDENVSYGCGEFVMKDKMLKQCLEQTTGTFDETKWKDAYLTDMLRGGGGEPVLLWENPSPTSEFAQQKVEIDLTDYIGVIIEYGTIVSTDVYSRLYVKKSDTLSLGNNIYLGAGYTQISTESRACSRSISAIDNTGITFTNCVNGLTTQNFNCVPTKIYGVKKYVVNSNLGGIIDNTFYHVLYMGINKSFVNTSSNEIGIRFRKILGSDINKLKTIALPAGCGLSIYSEKGIYNDDGYNRPESAYTTYYRNDNWKTVASIIDIQSLNIPDNTTLFVVCEIKGTSGFCWSFDSYSLK